MRHIEIEVDNHSLGKLTVDGLELERVTKVTFEANPGSTPRVGLEIVARDGTISAEGNLVIDGIEFLDEENERQVYELLKRKYSELIEVM
jgi:hypothetical protein